METETILVTGAYGQIGSELVEALQKLHGKEHVIALDVKEAHNFDGIYEQCSVLDNNRLQELQDKYKFTQIYHLAALLSGTSEKDPKFAWELNTMSLLYILDLAKEHSIKLFWPSSIAVYGNDAQKDQTPQDEKQNPTSVYGISKTAGELWCKYYFEKHNVDVRSIRYPGLISWKTKAGGGTTDYAVEIFYEALEKGTYNCFLTENTYLPMLYMEDAIQATIQLMLAPKDAISVRTSYNLGGLSFSPKELISEIKKHIPALEVTYVDDFRQAFADSWPNSIDDSVAEKDWNFSPKFNLEKMTEDMILNLKKKMVDA